MTRFSRKEHGSRREYRNLGVEPQNRDVPAAVYRRGLPLVNGETFRRAGRRFLGPLPVRQFGSGRLKCRLFWRVSGRHFSPVAIDAEVLNRKGRKGTAVGYGRCPPIERSIVRA